MSRGICFILLASFLFILLPISVSAGRLILIPTAETVGTGIKAEYLTRTDSDDGEIFCLQLNISPIEIEGIRFRESGMDDVDAVSGQFALLPETSFTPGIAVGIRDISDDTGGQGVLYEGQAFYIVATQGIPITGGVPVLFSDMKVHAGIGTDSLKGIFFGVEGRLPMDLRLSAEYDTDDLNAALSYKVIPSLQVKVASIKGDIFYGAELNLSL